MRHVFLAVCLTCVGIPMIGCAAPPTANGPSTVSLQVVDRDGFIDSAITVLREHDFQTSHVDRSAGTIVSTPTTSKQWFEFWRHDAPGGYQLLESSVHTVRRRVTIDLSPDVNSNDRPLDITVRVAKERRSAPERQVTVASSALGIYSNRLPTVEGYMAPRGHDVHWIPLGRDVLFEEYLLERFVAANPAATPVPTTPSAPAGQPSPPVQPTEPAREEMHSTS